MAPYDAVPPPPSISTSPVAFKEVLARLASGVAIISYWDGDTPRGLLVSSITGLSVEPPRFLFCVRKEAACHDSLVVAEALNIAILSADDEEEALRFSTSARSDERFSPERWILSRYAPPTFRGGLAITRCRRDSVVDAHSHSLVIVSAQDHIVGRGLPLVAWNRSFGTSAER